MLHGSSQGLMMPCGMRLGGEAKEGKKNIRAEMRLQRLLVRPWASKNLQCSLCLAECDNHSR